MLQHMNNPCLSLNFILINDISLDCKQKNIYLNNLMGHDDTLLMILDLY